MGLIDKERLVTELQMAYGEPICSIEEAIDVALTTIDEQPAVDAEPIRHGHWIEDRSIGDCCYKCSECGFIRDAYLLEVEDYCPQCGAKMDPKRLQWAKWE